MSSRPLSSKSSTFTPLPARPASTLNRLQQITAKVNSNNPIKQVVIKSDNFIAKRRAEVFDRVNLNRVSNLFTIEEPDSFVLLDFRTEKEYNESHLKKAINYPIQKILQDKISTELYMLKEGNKPIFGYGANEKTTVEAVSVMNNKGWSCVALTGGFEEISRVPGTLENDQIFGG
jgi:rhodanese-related sulfurtransferase